MNNEKWDALLADLHSLGRVAVAFSAGVDSTFLLKAAHTALGQDVLAITGRFVSFPGSEDREAAAFCRELGVEQVIVEVNQMAIPGFRDNPPDRCYLCKKALFSMFLEAARTRGFDCVAEGSNADDVGDYRPGLRAIAELGIRSPLKDVGLTKGEIRALSRTLGLPTWDKPSMACLATRFPYGERITQEKLAAVDAAEQLLRDAGFRQVRVRVHGDVARVEIDRAQFAQLLEAAPTIEAGLRALGFLYVTLDLGGYRMGSMNRTLTEKG